MLSDIIIEIEHEHGNNGFGAAGVVSVMVLVAEEQSSKAAGCFNANNDNQGLMLEKSFVLLLIAE